jgi:nitric oxide synthase oxygenase domain/subunit
MFDAICNHIRYAYNDGIIRSAITIFRQRTELDKDFRVWNSQFFSYAGYKLNDNTYVGDKAQIEFTKICIKLGWTPKYTDFDVLPLILQANGQDPEMFELPSDLIREVEIIHPKFTWFADLKLRWYCIPAVASMKLDIGGLEFTACPFNGWYMCTEISRNLSDSNRFHKLPLIAEKMELDIKNVFSLWKDKALVELNYAVLNSYQKNNITITDHHSASESFMKHYENESQIRGGCPADWVWVSF